MNTRTEDRVTRVLAKLRAALEGKRIPGVAVMMGSEFEAYRAKRKKAGAR